MGSSDAYGLGYHDVDGDEHTGVLVENMDATAEWRATRQLRSWERQQLGLAVGERLLDVGCGRGEAAIALGADLGPMGELVGVDASAAMIEVARQGIGELSCAVRFSVGDAYALVEADGAFDVVRSERTLQWLPAPGDVVKEFGRVLRRGGRLSLIDTDWSTLHLDVGDPKITRMISEGLRIEQRRPSNVGRRLATLAADSGFEVTAETTATQIWSTWNPDESPAPDGCFSMSSLAEDLVERGQLEARSATQLVRSIEDAARERRFTMSLKMHAIIARRAAPTSGPAG